MARILGKSSVGWALKEWMAFSSFSRPLQAVIGPSGLDFPTSAPSKTNVSPLYLGTPEFSAQQYYEVEERRAQILTDDISRPR